MPTAKPVSRIDRGGRPGRPAEVRNVARRVLAAKLADILDGSSLLPSAIPRKYVERVTGDGATALLDALRAEDLHVVPGRIMRELALIVGEAAPPRPLEHVGDIGHKES